MGEEVWETSVEQRVRDDGYASKLKHFCICDFERLVTRQTHSPIKNFAKMDTKSTRRYRGSPTGFSGSVRFCCVALRYSKTSESESISVGA